MNVNDGGDMGKIPKLKIVSMGSNPTLQLLIGMFIGVVVREKDGVPPAKITMLYGILYEIVWLWRYCDGKMAPRHEKFSHAYQIFFT